MDFDTRRAVFSTQRADFGALSRTSSSLSRIVVSFREPIHSLRENHGFFNPSVATSARKVSCQKTGGMLQ